MKNSTGRTIKIFSIIYLVLVLLGGIVLGVAFKVPSSRYSYYQSYDFNWSFALGFWIYGSVVALILFALAEIIFLLQGIKDRLPALEDEGSQNSEESQEDETSQDNEDIQDDQKNLE